MNTFEDLYRNVPANKREMLRQFRAAHPYKHLTVNGVQWNYIACGQGAEALLILGGGFAVGESAFRTILKYESDYRIISPSYPPVGKMGIVADGLAAILDAEGIKQAHVYGHSLGSAVAHVFARRHPERVGKLILSGFGLHTDRTARRAKFLIKLFALLPYAAIRAFYAPRIKRLLAGVEEAERAFMLAYMEELFSLHHNKQSAMAQFALLAETIDRAEAYKVFAPVTGEGKVLIIAAEDDRGFTHVERERLIATYPGAHTRIFEIGGHWAMLTRRVEYEAALERFLKGEPPPRVAAKRPPDSLRDVADVVREREVDSLAKIGVTEEMPTTLGAPSAIAALLRPLRLSHIRKEAAGLLGRIKGIRAFALFAGAPTAEEAPHRMEEDIITALEHPADVDALIKSLCHPDLFVRNRAAAMLVKLGRPVVPRLIQELHNADPCAVEQAINALEEIGDPHALGELRRIQQESRNAELKRKARLAAESIKRRMQSD